MKAAHPATDLAALLLQRREAIQSAWTSLLRGLPDCHYETSTVEELDSWTAQGVGALIESLHTRSPEPLEAHASRVSRVRTRLGFEIDEVVEGLLLLQEAALVEIVDAYLGEPDRAREATLQLGRCIRTMLASFAAKFAERMQRSVIGEQERSRLLLEAVEAAGSSLDLDLVLSNVADSLKRALGGSYGAVFLWDESKEALSRRAWPGATDDPKLGKRAAELVTPPVDPLITRALSTRSPVTGVCSDGEHLLTAELCEADGVGGATALPILLADRILALAVIWLGAPPNLTAEEQIDLAQGIVNAVAPAVDNAQRYARAREQLVETRRLEQVTASFLGVRSLKEVLELICSEVRRLTGAGAASVHLADESGELRCAFSSGADADAASNAPRLSLALRIESHNLGQLVLSELSQPLDEVEERLVRRFADHAAAAIEHAGYHEQKEALAALEERQKLAHELHDSVTQSLYGVTMYAEAAARLQETGNPSRANELLRTMRDTSLKALREMRLLLFDLRPPPFAEHGLVAALQARLSAVEGRAGVQTQLTAEGVESLPHELAEELYGICTEALNNSLKHAQASRIAVRLHQAGPSVCLEVEDDGRGFDPAGAQGAGGMGLVGMEERAARLGARLSVTSRLGEGTSVKVEAPLGTPPNEPERLEGRTG
jgi:signal transduction histidine kinase